MQNTNSIRNHGRNQRGARGPDSPENYKKVKFLSNTCLDPLKNHKATKPAFNVGPSSGRRRNAIQMAFRWRDYDGHLLVLFGSSLPSVRVGPLWQKILDPRMKDFFETKNGISIWPIAREHPYMHSIGIFRKD